MWTFEASASTSDGRMSAGELTLLLYLLGKNGRIDDARALLANIDTQKTPALGSFAG